MPLMLLFAKAEGQATAIFTGETWLGILHKPTVTFFLGRCMKKMKASPITFGEARRGEKGGDLNPSGGLRSTLGKSPSPTVVG